jgi:hypothetical protein
MIGSPSRHDPNVGLASQNTTPKATNPMTPRQRKKNLPSTAQSSLFPPVVNQHGGRETAKMYAG